MQIETIGEQNMQSKLESIVLTLMMAAMVLLITFAPVSAAKDTGKTLNMSLFWLDADIDPSQAWHGWTLTRTGVGENLVQIDENLNFKAVIAESWEQPDELTTVFKIRKGIKFQNGAPADAKACKASIERVLAISDRKDMKFPVDSITAEGDLLTIKTTTPFATLVNVLADPTYIIVDAAAAEKNPEGFKMKPICTGPYKVESFSQDAGLVLSKHEEYWKGEPAFDTVNAKRISDGATRTMALQSGELDFATQLGTRDLALLEKDDKFVVHKGPNLRVFMVRLNFDRPYMKLEAFRQALMHGISKDVYATKIANSVPARGPFNSLLSFAYKGDDFYTYNPEKAKQLLDKAGIIDKDGDGIREMDGKNIVLKFVCTKNHGKDAKNIGTAMQAQYKAIGLGVTITQLENNTDTAKKGDFDFLYERWTSAPTADPQYFLESSFKTGARGNYGHYSSPALDAVCDKLHTTMDKTQRDQLGIEGTKILLKDTAGIFFFYGLGNVVTSKRVDGVHRFISEIYYIDDRVKLK